MASSKKKPFVVTLAEQKTPIKLSRHQNPVPANPNIVLYVSAITTTLQNAVIVTKNDVAFVENSVTKTGIAGTEKGTSNISCYDFNQPNKLTTVSRFKSLLDLSSSFWSEPSRVPDR